MDLKYSVEKSVILKNYAHSKLILEGWAISYDGDVPFFRVLVNGSESRMHQCYIDRPDIVESENLSVNQNNRNSHSFGFLIVASCTEWIQSISLIAERDHEYKEILKLEQNEIESHSVSGSFLARVEITEREGNLCKVKGWVLPADDASVTVENTDGQRLESTYHLTTRYDLCDAGFIEEDEKLCGYELTFVPDGSEQYEIIISNGKESVRDYVVMEQQEQKSSVLKSLITNINLETIGKAVNYLKVFGFKELINRLKKGYTPYTAYDTWFRDHRITTTEMERQKKEYFKYHPLISIAVPTYNTPVDMLKVMIDSVIEQTYSNWELCIADAGDPDHESRSILKEYEQKDSRIKVRYLDENFGIAGNTNQAMELATGEYIGLLDHDDFLEPDALFEVVARLNEYPYVCLYTDEDKYDTTKGTFEEPNFKPDFNIDALRSHNYITHFFVAKTDLIRSVGGEHSEYDGAQDYDLILRCTEKADRVGHIAKSLYHWRIYSGSTAGNPEQKLYCYEAGRKAIADHLERVGLNGTVELMPKPYWGMYHTKYTVSGNPIVSIIIPNYENKNVLERCINSIVTVNTYKNIEVIIVENNSTSEEIFAYYEQVQKRYDNVHVVKWNGTEFNYSAINNYGVSFAKGEYLLLLNNDTEMISPDAIKEMLGICMRDDVGVVGAKLLYPDNTVQHAGVMVGIGGTAGHLFSRILNQDPGYMMRAILNYDLSAVTGACLMTKKNLYERVGGLDESLKVAYNDVDYCLKVRAENRLVVYNAYSQWYHYESVSRGYETDIRKIRRFDSEVKLFQKKWKKMIVGGDPYYNRNLMDERIAK